MGKRENYFVPNTEDMGKLIFEINRVLKKIEDRLDRVEGNRSGFVTTQPWEEELAKVKK